MADAREGAGWFYTDQVDAPRLGIHAVDRVIRVARYLGATVVEPRFDLPIGEAERRWAVETLAEVPSPRIVLNLGARWLTKRWPPEHFAAIARRAVSEFGAGLIAVGSAEDRPIVDTLLRLVAPLPVLDLCGRTRLLQLAALTRESDLVISNDTGPLHLAAAAGARVIGIYTCTDPTLTGPYGPNAFTVKSCVWCAPSFIKKCGRLECMTELTPERVWPVVKDQIERAIATPRAARDRAGGDLEPSRSSIVERDASIPIVRHQGRRKPYRSLGMPGTGSRSESTGPRRHRPGPRSARWSRAGSGPPVTARRPRRIRFCSVACSCATAG